MSNNEFSESGSPILRHDSKEVNFESTNYIDFETKEKFENHIEKYIGNIDSVFHEIISSHVHIDTYHIKPTNENPFHTLITHGMSDIPMNVPEGCEEWSHMELLCLLPKEMNVSDEILNNGEHQWILSNLIYLAKLPHLYNTWLGYGHTVQNGTPIEPYSEDTKLCSSFIIPTITFPEDFSILEISEEKTIYIYNAFPIYLEEMDFKMKHGADSLLDKFDEYELDDLYILDRPNTCKKKSFFDKFK